MLVIRRGSHGLLRRGVPARFERVEPWSKVSTGPRGLKRFTKESAIAARAEQAAYWRARFLCMSVAAHIHDLSESLGL